MAVLVSWTLTEGTHASDWARFRGPNGSGVSTDRQELPVKWSETENLKWKAELPGPGLSSPIVVGKRVFVTCWTGYGMDRRDPGEQSNLKRHLVCLDRETGKTLWSQAVGAFLPEDPYRGMFTQHGYASHTPVSDGERVYAFFGKTGVMAFDLDGKVLWQRTVGNGSGIRGWGTASSPILYKNLVIVTTSAESESLVAFDRGTGKEVWRQEVDSLAGTWSTPILVDVGDGRQDLVLAVPYEIWGLNPENGKLRWYLDGVGGETACASVTAHDGVVYALGARGGGSAAVRAGGKGDVSKSHVVWTGEGQSRIGTPIVQDGRVYWINGGIVNCVDAKTGQRVYQARLQGAGGGEERDRGGRDGGGGRSGRDGGGRGGGGYGGGGFGGQDYSSPVSADGKLYFVTRSGVGYVLKLGPKFELLARNRFDTSDEFSATPAVSDGQLFIRSNRTLFCVAKLD